MVLSKHDHAIEITPKHRLFAKWSIDGIADSTHVSVHGEDKPTTVTVLEANEQHMRMGSRDWRGIKDIPKSYLRSEEIRIIPGPGRPTVLVPIGRIEEVRIHDRKLGAPQLGRYVEIPRYIVIGALGGACVAIVSLFEVEDREELADLKGTDLAVAAAVGTIVGGICYPVVEVFRPRYREIVKTYRIGDEEGYSIRCTAQ
jgi:hypothetical protein